MFTLPPVAYDKAVEILGEEEVKREGFVREEPLPMTDPRPTRRTAQEILQTGNRADRRRAMKALKSVINQ